MPYFIVILSRVPEPSIPVRNLLPITDNEKPYYQLTDFQIHHLLKLQGIH